MASKLHCDVCDVVATKGREHFWGSGVPDGWVRVEVGFATRDADGEEDEDNREAIVCSKRCLMKWLVKLERAPA